jgi:hypothetical protein
MVNGNHPWLLVGPWYQWSTPNDPSAGRNSAPVFQKYETADLVNEFLKNPQHSLVFLDQEDRVFEVTPRVPPIPLLKGKKQSFSNNLLKNTGIRKLFLDAHKRFYLVVCELHCDVAGFPSVTRDQVCEAGFVVRRHAVQVPKSAEKELRQAVRQSSPQAIHAVAQKHKVQAVLQGWIPSGFDRIGSWQEVDELPQVITETIHPLYPLVPDPRAAKHAGKGHTIYFGAIPTGSADTDNLGNARFDDHSLYEIRCYVRRHRLQCPKKSTRNDCHGELNWSQHTEHYQLASHFDLVGTSNRPVTIQLPNLPALEAQVASDPSIGRKAPVKMVSPKGSNLETSGKIPDLVAKTPGAAICSFSIPLITIVASFVFRLFLPIVVFVFQLWWMLALRFCIPPSFSLSASVAAGLKAHLDANVDATFAANVKANLSGNLGPDAATQLDNEFTPGFQADFSGNLSADLSASLPPDIPVDPPVGTVAVTAESPSITANLQYTTEVSLS